jgi:hypothetical protein
MKIKEPIGTGSINLMPKASGLPTLKDDNILKIPNCVANINVERIHFESSF